MAVGIYKITNKINNKIYIGSTTRLSARKAEHKYKLKNYKGNSIIRNAVLKHGEDNFIFEIIEELIFGEWSDKQYINDILTGREQYYIDTLFPQYNIRITDVNRCEHTCTEQHLAHLRRIAKIPKDRSSYKKPVYQICSEGNIIKEFRCAQDAEKELNLYKGSVSRVISGEYTHTRNYYFKLKN